MRCGVYTGAEARERWGAGALSRASHGSARGGGRGARLGGMARGEGIQRGGEWGQGAAEVPRVAVGKQELACGPPRLRAAPLCAGGRGSREVEDEGWT